MIEKKDMPRPTISTINYLIAVPLIVMSYHIYNFYETEPVVIRVGLAVSFDLMVVICFYLLKDRYIAASRQARMVTWATLMVLVLFQLYVNVWAYAHLHWLRAAISGGIFPLVVALVSYIGMLREKHADLEAAAKRKEEREASRLDRMSTATELLALATGRPYADRRVEKADVIKAYGIHDNITQTRELFLGSTNMKSVDRWLEKLNNGEAL